MEDEAQSEKKPLTAVEKQRGVSLISIECGACPDQHHNYWECGACGKRLGEMIKPTMHRGDAYKFCPNCGVKISN